jgi:hypothetical protein
MGNYNGYRPAEGLLAVAVVLLWLTPSSIGCDVIELAVSDGWILHHQRIGMLYGSA